MLRVKLIIASTRPGRKGKAIADWIHGLAQQQPDWSVEVLDLATINLPFLDEPNHPRMRQYQHQHTKDWSAQVDSADAFILIFPEYNHAFNAPLKNALDYLYHEWRFKPVALVSYGGVSAGTRAAQMLKPVLTALSMMPLSEAVAIPMFTQFINEQGQFNGNEPLTNSAKSVFHELDHWAKAMQVLREPAKQ